MLQAQLVYGVPGSGKTYLSKRLAAENDLEYIEGDDLKKLARKGHTKINAPFLFLGTCQAYRQFGELCTDTAVKGLLAVRTALNPIVNETIQGRNNFVLEGAFLDPISLQSVGKLQLIVTTNERLHRKHFFRHLDKLFDRKQFEAARLIQDYLIGEANKLHIEVIDNSD